jgi:pantoate--beta-alanine ligase
MDVIRTVSDMRATARAHARAGQSVGLVPTMGAFHDGHLSLMRAARSSCDAVVVSIFVNPLQFGPNEDFEAYPRDEKRDLRLARAEEVDVVFVPSEGEIYAPDHSTVVNVGPLGTILEGEARPGHFEGVCTIVAKLFNIVGPSTAFFGRKDAQQVAVVKRMVSDLCFGLEIAVCPTVREPDGLAMSSRNRFLDYTDRKSAGVLFRALKSGERLVAQSTDPEVVDKEMWDVMRSEERVVPEYARVVDPESFGPARPGGPLVLAVAARVGGIRLIDNLLIA